MNNLVNKIEWRATAESTPSTAPQPDINRNPVLIDEAPTNQLIGIKRNSSEAEYPPSLAWGELRKGYSPLTPSSDQPVGRYAAKENKPTPLAAITSGPVFVPKPGWGKKIKRWLNKYFWPIVVPLIIAVGLYIGSSL